MSRRNSLLWHAMVYALVSVLLLAACTTPGTQSSTGVSSSDPAVAGAWQLIRWQHPDHARMSSVNEDLQTNPQVWIFNPEGELMVAGRTGALEYGWRTYSERGTIVLPGFYDYPMAYYREEHRLTIFTETADGRVAYHFVHVEGEDIAGLLSGDPGRKDAASTERQDEPARAPAGPRFFGSWHEFEGRLGEIVYGPGNGYAVVEVNTGREVECFAQFKLPEESHDQAREAHHVGDARSHRFYVFFPEEATFELGVYVSEPGSRRYSSAATIPLDGDFVPGHSYYLWEAEAHPMIVGVRDEADQEDALAVPMTFQTYGGHRVGELISHHELPVGSTSVALAEGTAVHLACRERLIRALQFTLPRALALDTAAGTVRFAGGTELFVDPRQVSGSVAGDTILDYRGFVVRVPASSRVRVGSGGLERVESDAPMHLTTPDGRELTVSTHISCSAYSDEPGIMAGLAAAVPLPLRSGPAVSSVPASIRIKGSRVETIYLYESGEVRIAGESHQVEAQHVIRLNSDEELAEIVRGK